MPPRKAITERMARWVDEYLVDLNATQAAIRAGYLPKNAHIEANRLKNHPVLKGMLEERQRARQKRLEVAQDMVIQELARVAMSDIRDVVEYTDAGVQVRPFDELSENAARAIQSVKCTQRRVPRGGGYLEPWEVQTIEVKLHPKVPALAELRAHFAPDDAPQSGDTFNLNVENNVVTIDGLTPEETRRLAYTVLEGDE